MLNRIKNLLSEEKGQGLTEYGLLLAVVVGIVVIVCALFRDQLKTLFTNVITALNKAVTDSSKPTTTP